MIITSSKLQCLFLPRVPQQKLQNASGRNAYRNLINHKQAPNQLGIPRGSKSFLRRAQIFYTMSN